MTRTHPVVFLFDVDNALLDNDSVQAHLDEHLEQAYGVEARDRYWEILEGLRGELGYVDYFGALERFRVEAMHRPDALRMSSWLVNYPFAARLYPGALDAVKHVQPVGGTRSSFPTAMPRSGRSRWSVPRSGERSMIAYSSTSTRSASLNTSRSFIPPIITCSTMCASLPP